MYCNESWKSLSQHLFLKFSVSFCFVYFAFIFMLHFCIQILIIMNIQWSKQPDYTWSYLWNLNFVVCFSYFWKDKLFLVWNVFRPNSSMEGDERGIFSKAPDWKLLFLLKIKIKQNTVCTNKEYNVIFTHIHQNIVAYPRSKKHLDWSMIGKILLHIGKNPSKTRWWQTS